MPYCAPLTDRTEGIVPVQIGGSARGYQELFVPSTALASPGYDGQPVVYLYIAELEVNALNCRCGCFGLAYMVVPSSAAAARGS
jgi:hypothetical protein